MNLIDRFYSLNDSAMEWAECARVSSAENEMQNAEIELRESLILRNRMRLMAWNSPKIQKLVAELSGGQKVEYDEKLLGV